MLKQLLNNCRENNIVLCVIGLGRVGLPLALNFANSGIQVIGTDINKNLIKNLKRKKTPFLEEGIEKFIETKNFFPESNLRNAIQQSNAIIICIDIPLKRKNKPDLYQFKSLLKKIVKIGINGKLIIFRSTLPPLTFDKFVIPFLGKNTKLKIGENFGLSICPSRTIEGKALVENQILPEIIGGVDNLSKKITAELFKKINPSKKMFLTTPRAAELAKLFANNYRYINFVLANEIALIAEKYGEDAHEIIKMINEGYSRGGIPIPGLTEGPCLTKDGHFSIFNNNSYSSSLIKTANEINDSVTEHLMGKLEYKLKSLGKNFKDCKIAIFGMAFKAGIDDSRNSPSIKIVDSLKKKNAKFAIYDPYLKGTSTIEDAISNADAIVLAVNHPEFKEIHHKIQKFNLVKRNCVLFDCWGMLNKEECKKSGFVYMRFGSGKD